MSTLYFVPATGDPDELVALATKAGIKVLAPETVRSFILETNGQDNVIVMVKALDLLLLTQKATSLLDTLPTVVMTVPGLVYTHEWSGPAAVFPRIDYLELKERLSKTGAMAFAAKDIQKRATGQDSTSPYTAMDDDLVEGGDDLE